MTINIIGIIVLLALAAFLIWLTLRIFRSRRPVLKWAGGLLSGLLTLVVTAVSVLALVGFFKIYLNPAPPVPAITVASTPDKIARGEHLASIVCIDCHTLDQTLPLSGGPDMGEESPVPVGSLIPSNLTPAGPLQLWTDGEIFRTIRHGVGKDGQKLPTMVAMGTRYMSDEDIEAVIAYLRSQPAVENEIAKEQLSVLGLAMVGAGLFPALPPTPEQIVAPAKGETVEYGQYVVQFSGCADCHGSDLSGGAGGFLPVGPNLRAIVPNWTRDEFVTTLRTGVNPNGHVIPSEVMPWKSYARLDDVELNAVYEYLHSLEPIMSQ